MKMGIVGTRTFEDYEYFKRTLDWYNIDSIITGCCPTGADELARRYSHEILLKKPVVHYAEWITYGKSAGPIRNKLIVRDCDELIAFWDGKSRGTLSSINLAKDAGKPVYTIWPTTDNLVDGIGI